MMFPKKNLGFKKKKKRNKFNAVKVKDAEGNVVADSISERHYWTKHLALREKAGQISDIKHWVTVHLTTFVKWKLDYTYIENGQTIYVDVKGKATSKDGRFLTLVQLWRTHGPGTLELAEKVYRGRFWLGQWNIRRIRVFDGNA